jgi:S-adenosylmethionine:tRNA ribosyltransferase-isomerase
MAERFEVNASTAAIVNRARSDGRRIVAVGTTSVRAIESAVRAASIVPARGWTDLVLTPERRTVMVDGIVTGWHPPEASHLELIQAVAGPEAVSEAYRAAETLGYRSHEFGDSCLLLRD